MADFTTAEQAAFIDIYSGEEGESAISPEVIKSIADRGLIKQNSDGTVGMTNKGKDLYQHMQGDEPFEGI